MKSISLAFAHRVVIMFISSLSQDEADKLYKIPKSVVKGTNRWIPKSSENPVSFYLEIDLVAEDK